jgi:hypothetical protein
MSRPRSTVSRRRYACFAKDDITYLVFEHKDIVVIDEVSIDVFESTACCLRIEKIHEWHERSVEHGPDDVELPAKRADADWSDLYHDEITDPIGGRSQRRSTIPHRHGVDFCTYNQHRISPSSVCAQCLPAG